MIETIVGIITVGILIAIFWGVGYIIDKSADFLEQLFLGAFAVTMSLMLIVITVATGYFIVDIVG